MLKKSRVIFILPSLHAGGTENYVLRFIKFVEKKFDFYILSPNLHKGDLHTAFEKEGCTISYQSIGYFNPIKIINLYLLIKHNQFDAICSFNGNFGGIPLLIAKWVGIKKRIAWYRRSSNAFGNNYFKLIYNNIVNKLVDRSATKILSNSEFALQNFYGLNYRFDARFKIILNGVNAFDYNIFETKEEARQKLGLPIEAFIIGHVGRFDPAKNHETIFKVAALLKLENPKIIFLFCGKNTDSTAFYKRLKYYGIEDMCICLGLSNKLPFVYRSLDVFYFPSITEGQPNALIEAMLSETVIIPSNIPPILEILDPALNIQLVEAKNTNLAKQIILKISDGQISYNVKEVKEFAKIKFNPELRFGEFVHELIN